MPDLINQLKEEAYNYFPKGLHDGDEKYKESVQFLNLVSQLKGKGKSNRLLKKIAKEILVKFGSCYFDNLTVVNPFDRCVKGKFYMCEDSYVMVYISVIIPYYVLYEARTIWDKLTYSEYLNNEFVNKVDTDSFKPFCLSLEELISRYFISYKRLDFTALSADVDDIVFNGNGMLATSTTYKYNYKMTVFNVFFSDTIF